MAYTKVFSRNEINDAAAIIKNGGIIAMPTETVYGLGANAYNASAVKKIFEAKGREDDNPLIVHIAGFGDWSNLVKRIPKNAMKLAERFWPGPLTIVLPKAQRVPEIVTGGLNTVAVRMPRNKIALYFIQACGCPIAAPSANLSGSPSPTKFNHVLKDMNGRIDGIIDGGDCKVGVESTVISFATEVPTILRPGEITKEQIESVIGTVKLHEAVLNELKDDDKAESPGMKYKHYAPKARLTVLKGTSRQYIEYLEDYAAEGAVALCFKEQEGKISIPTVSIGSEKDSSAQANLLFDALRKLDEMEAEVAYAPMPSDKGVGLAVVNRLLRAAAFNVVDLDEWETKSDELREFEKRNASFKNIKIEDIDDDDVFINEAMPEIPDLLSFEIEENEDKIDLSFLDDDDDYEDDDDEAEEGLEKIEGIRVIGITGKTGAGKSVIAKQICDREPDSYVIDADRVSHYVLNMDEVAVALVYTFDKSILTKRRVDRKKLAKLVFSDIVNLNKLNEITHPIIAREIIKLIKLAKEKELKTIILDAPTLIESGINEICDEVIFVRADKDVRTTRIIARDNLTLDEARARMRFEKSDEFYERFANRIIDNN